MKSRRTKALEIPQRVTYAVWERDEARCILCGSQHAAPEAHFVPRSAGGLGIEENIVTLCRSCHDAYDQSTFRKPLGKRIETYLCGKYPEWDKSKLYYRKENE